MVSVATDLHALDRPTRTDVHRTLKRESIGERKLADLDSNQDKQNQNLLCYRYTIGQYREA